MNASVQTVEEWECVRGCRNWWGERGVTQQLCPQCGSGGIYPTGIETHIKMVGTELQKV